MRHFSYFIFFSLFTLQAAVGAETTSIYNYRASGPASIAMAGDLLVISQNVTREIAVYSHTKKKIIARLPGSWGNISIAASGEKAAVCLEGGEHLFVFDARRPRSTLKKIYFPKSQEVSCNGISFDPRNNDHIWFSSLLNKSIYKIDSQSRRILKRFYPISGPFRLQVLGDFIFSQTDYVTSNEARPLIFNHHTGKVHAGNPDGSPNNTTLDRNYASSISPGLVTQNVYYIRPYEGMLHYFNVAQPSEEALKTHQLSLSYPFMAAEHGECLAVMGTQSTSFWSEINLWEFVKLKEGSLTDESTVVNFHDPLLVGARRIAVAPDGTTYISTFKNVVRVDGFFEEGGCL